MSNTLTLKLSKPIKVYKDEVSDLELREPTGKDLSEIGYPMQFGENGVQPNGAIVAKLISRLAAIPPNSVGQLAASDFQAAMVTILGFLGGNTISSTAIGTLPDSGATPLLSSD